MTLKHSVFQAVDRLVRPLDVTLQKWSQTTEARRTLFCSQERITLALDVGAATGAYGQSLRRAGYTGRIVSFEPLPASFTVLTETVADDPLWEGRAIALGAESGDAVLQVSGNRDSSSLLPILDRHVDGAATSAVTSTVTIRTEPLDHLDIVGPSDRALLKMDTQGFEAQVLAGAASSLEHVHLIESELSLVPLYDGAPLYDEMIDLLAGHGFHLIWMERGFTHLTTKRLMQFDAIFARGTA